MDKMYFQSYFRKISDFSLDYWILRRVFCRFFGLVSLCIILVVKLVSRRWRELTNSLIFRELYFRVFWLFLGAFCPFFGVLYCWNSKNKI